MPVSKWTLFKGAVSLFLGVVYCAVWAAPSPAGPWVGAWASSPQLVEPQNRPPEPGLPGNTLRQVIHVTLAGSQIRLRLSNEFGHTPLTLSSVHIALPAGPGAIKPESDRPITFHQRQAVTIPSGALMFSDPLPFTVKPGSDLVVTLRASVVPEGITGHPGSRATSYLSVGDGVTAATLPDAVTMEHWYFIDGLDVVSDGASVVTLGDSITDGRGSITNQNTRWPDYLYNALQVDKRLANRSVLNEGIGGNRILGDGLGPSALSRFDRDVLTQSGVRWVLVLEGVNDIGGLKMTSTHEDVVKLTNAIILAYEQFIVRAHTRGLRIYGATITPFGQASYSNPSSEEARDQINTWIRTSGQFDAVVDFDKAIRSATADHQLDPRYDSGDHLHPNSDGYRKMAAAIDPSLFAR